MPIVEGWRTAILQKTFRVNLIISGILLFACAVLAPTVFQYVQNRPGFILPDPVLDWLPAQDLSNWIFLILYALIIAGIMSLIRNPQQFLKALQAYALLTLMRFVTLLVVPLAAPPNLIELVDPVVQRLFYHQSITNDLFFSGHTSIVFLLAITTPSVVMRRVLYMGTLAIGCMVLIQHAHYTIDVLAAPLFAWLAVRLTSLFAGNDSG